MIEIITLAMLPIASPSQLEYDRSVILIIVGCIVAFVVFVTNIVFILRCRCRLVPICCSNRIIINTEPMASAAVL